MQWSSVQGDCVAERGNDVQLALGVAIGAMEVDDESLVVGPIGEFAEIAFAGSFK